MRDEEFSYEDSESYRSDEKVSVKDIILRLFQKALREGSKEMTAAGVQKRLIDGQVVELAVPNQMQIFVNSVQMVEIPLKPYFKKTKNKRIKQTIENIPKQLIKTNKIFNQETEKLKEEYKNKLTHYSASYNSDIAEYNQKLNQLEDGFELEQVRIYKQLLDAISYLLFELNYFAETSINF